MQKRKLEGNSVDLGIQQRLFTVKRDAINEDDRTVELAFSSEKPVERYFGKEILDHTPSAVRLGRMQSGGALLMDHDMRDQIGVVEKISIGSDRVGRATVRFGKSARADEIFTDVLDGIRSNISVGYAIHRMQLEDPSADEEVYRATDWEPLEISIVSVPADETVGVGRSHETESIQTEIIGARKMPEVTETPVEETRAAAPAPVVEVDTNKIETDTREAELNRIREIDAEGEAHGYGEMARTFIQDGKSLDEFRAAMLTEMRKQGASQPVVQDDIGMSQNEVRGYSFMRMINALANPGSRRAQEAAAFELEASDAVAQRMGRDPQGIFVPLDVLRAGQRDLTAGTATAGGHTVGTELLGDSFIERLENAMLVKELGATTMNDLQGNIAIPRLTGGATAYWVAENGDTTESAQTFDQVTLSPKTVGGFVDISRRLLSQSSIDVENMVRNDLALRLALALDNKAIAGDGTGNTPTGIVNATGVGSVTLAALGNPTYGEVVDIESEVSTDNALLGALAYMTTPAVAGNMKQKAKDSGSGRFVLEGGEANGHRVAATNQCPANTIVFGNWKDLLIGTWGGIDLNLDTSTGSKAGTMRVVALQDVDVAVRHGESFAKGTGGS